MFKFLRDDPSVESGVRRIALSQSDLALNDLDAIGGKDRGEAIHSARKHLKKLRSLLRLVRPVTENSRRENAAVRDVAAGLSATRDGKVLVETFDGLADEAHPTYDAMRVFRDVLAQDYQRLDAKSAESTETTVLGILAIRERASQWTLGEDGFEAVGSGLRATYAAARASMKQCRKRPSPEVFHEWRKAVKNHGYRINLLRDCAPQVLRPQGELWEQLGEMLGDHHNLAVLREKLEQSRGDVGQLQDLQKAIDDRSSTLENDSFELGRQLLAENPKAVVRRFEAYWCAWKEGR
jgi:CHAD domain-containing protein